jgi:spore coat polysaccharide biosynthesis protein SpsF
MILVILQARLSSKRLPGKVLKPVLGKPMLIRQIERIKKSTLIDKLVVATSNHNSDDAIAALCQENKIDCFRGDLDDVLGRFYECSQKYNPDHIIRLTGDCPLIDHKIIDETIKYHLDNNFDYTSNVLKPHFPDGFDVEIFKYECLETAFKNAQLPSHREHVTQYIISRTDIYKIGNYADGSDFSDLRLTVDEQQDFDLIKIIYEKLYPHNPDFNLGDVIDLLDKEPLLKEINKGIGRNAGLKKSQEQDQLYLNHKN